MICPICKNEYRDGIKECLDCNVLLITKEQFKELEHAKKKEKEEQILAEQIALKEAFLKQEALKEEAFEQREVAEKLQETITAAKVYENSSDKAEDNRSSAYTLLGVGGIGLLVMILGMADVLPLNIHGTSKYMIYGIMSALFILFLVMGVISMKTSKVFAKKAESENSLRDTMEKWCLEHLTKEVIDGEAFLEEDVELTDEVKYFKRATILKARISMQFVNLDEAFLEHFTDEIYGDIFEENQVNP